MESQDVQLPFPLAGIDLLFSFDRQRNLTSPIGENVRAYEPAALRKRGGSRSGLSKYIPPQLPGGAHLVQCLGVVVDPTIPALLDNFDAPDPDPITGLTPVDDPSNNPDPSNPRNPGRKVRNGGSGRQPNRNKTSAVSLVQSAPYGAELSVLSLSGAFAKPVKLNNLLLAVVVTVDDTVGAAQDPARTVSISDTLGQTWNQIGGYSRVVSSYQTVVGRNENVAMSVWYVVAGSPGADTLTVTASSQAYLGFGIFEWQGLKNLGPLHNSASSSGTANASAMSPGSVTASGGDLVLAFLLRDQGAGTFDSFTGMGSASGAGNGAPGTLAVVYAGSLKNQNSNVTPTRTADAVATDWCAIAASFKKR